MTTPSVVQIFRLTYAYLKPNDKRSQHSLLCLSSEIRQSIYTDRNVLWKERFHDMTGMPVPPNICIDWALACKLAKESPTSLHLLNCPEITLHLVSVPTPMSLAEAIVNNKPNTLRELLKLDSRPFTIESQEILVKLIEFPKVLSVVLKSEVKLNHEMCVTLMAQCVAGCKLTSLKALLANIRTDFKQYHSELMLVALTVPSTQTRINYWQPVSAIINLGLVRILLADAKGTGIVRGYYASVSKVTNKALAKLIISHSNVLLCDDTIRRFSIKFGEKQVLTWLKQARA
jgi:hypothetical protein